MARTRYQLQSKPPSLGELPAAALRAVLHEGYGRADLRADALAGLIVGVVALPLAMALSIAVGAPPQHGLYTAIQPRTLLENAHITERAGRLLLRPDIQSALEAARAHLDAESYPPSASTSAGGKA